MDRRNLFLRRTCDTFNNQKRRARQHGVVLPYTLDDLRSLVSPCLGRVCCFCAEVLTERNFSLDHATPLCRGGGWATPNLVVCCLRWKKQS
jgi:hypothetical protein